MRKALALLLFITVPAIQVYAQAYVVKGTVNQEGSGIALAFVNIRVNESFYGGTTDIDGRFTIHSPDPFISLTFSYVGFESLHIPVEKPGETIDVQLQAKTTQLEEVLVTAGENPAHRIIQKLLDHRHRNNPEMMQSYAYTAYEKTVFTIDSTRTGLPGSTVPADTLLPDPAADFFGERDLLLLETVIEKKFLAPAHEKKTILASRVSGLQDPVLLFLITHMQPTGFYNDWIQIADKYYINPISQGSLRRYWFVLEDVTSLNEQDTLFTVSYRPREGTRFDGLKGVMMVHSDGWALQNIIAEPAERGNGLQIKVQQMYEKIEDSQWFPVQLNTEIVFHGLNVQSRGQSIPMVGIGKSYITDIQINPQLSRRSFDHIAIAVEPDAARKNESFWQNHRIESLRERELETYRYIDSVGQSMQLDRLMNTTESLLHGQIPIGFLDIDLSKVMRYNDFEGFYLGLGLQTNRKLSEHVFAEGFWGYGFRDKWPKYGLGMRLHPFKQNDAQFSFRYFQKATASGQHDFPFQSRSLLNAENFRYYYIDRMDISRGMHAAIQFRVFRNFQINLAYGDERKHTTYPYHFGPEKPHEDDIGNSRFRLKTISIGGRYALRESFMHGSRGLHSLGESYPVLQFNYTRSPGSVLGGDHDFERLDVQVEHAFYTKYLGRTELRAQAGWLTGEAPYMELYNSPASWRNFGLYAPYSFATMRMNEFLSDRYVHLFLSHDFGKLLYGSERFQPEFVVVSNLGFGSLNNPDWHHGVEFNTMEKGFYESGLLINNLLRLQPFSKLGVGVIYRYGPYSFDDVRKNFAFVCTLSFLLS